MPDLLILEPDPDLAGTLSKFLAPDFSLRTVHDAQTAIEQADEQTPDLVILELAMPRNNGVAFLQEFRSYTDWRRVPVIIYSLIPREDTGHNMPEWEKHGVKAYLYKPVTSLAILKQHIVENLNYYETV